MERFVSRSSSSSSSSSKSDGGDDDAQVKDRLRRRTTDVEAYLSEERRRNPPRGQIAGHWYHMRRYRGVCALLEARFYANFRGFDRQRSKRASTRSAGTSFHRHVHHYLFCRSPSPPSKSSSSSPCDCRRLFGTRTARPRAGSLTQRRLDRLRALMRERRWTPLASECVVVWPEANCATAVDLLVGIRDAHDPTLLRRLIVIELKTGYRRRQRRQARTLFPDRDGGKMLGPLDDVDNTQAHHHQLQLWATVEAFEHGHGLRVDDALVLYFDADRGHIEIEPSATWWSRCERGRRRRPRLREHFCRRGSSSSINEKE